MSSTDGRSLKIDSHNVRKFSIKCKKVFDNFKATHLEVMEDEEKRLGTFIDEFEPETDNYDKDKN